MRISDWSSDVCSSDLSPRRCWGCRGRIDAIRALKSGSRANAGHCGSSLRGAQRRSNPATLPDQTVRWIASSAFGLRSEEHTSELQSLMRISYAVFCLKKKKNKDNQIKNKLSICSQQ